MPDGSAPRRYSAFISYSHADRNWGEWVQRELEQYVVPADLKGRPTPMGVVPSTLRPVFRDRWDLAAGPSLTEQIMAALNNSRCLIVLCSPAAARSEYVNEEIRLFKRTGGERRIFSMIVGGLPGDPAQECFPEALVARGADGEIASSAQHPVAADARPEGDGKDEAKLKLIAGMMGVGLDEIRKREQAFVREELRKTRRRVAALAVLALLAAGSAVAAVGAYRAAEVQRSEAVKQRLEAEMQKAEAEKQRAAAVEQKAEAERQRAAAEKALGLALRSVVLSSTYRSLLDKSQGRQSDFSSASLQVKGESNDFQRFVASVDPKTVWPRLIDILTENAATPPSELRRYDEALESERMAEQWLRHAETISNNLVRTYDDHPEFKVQNDRVLHTLKLNDLEPKVVPNCPPALVAQPREARRADEAIMAQQQLPIGCD